MKLWRVLLSFMFGVGAFLLGMLSYKWINNGISVLTSLGAMQFILFSMGLAQDDGIHRGRNVGGKG